MFLDSGDVLGVFQFPVQTPEQKRALVRGERMPTAPKVEEEGGGGGGGGLTSANCSFRLS